MFNKINLNILRNIYIFEKLYLNCKEEYLGEINYKFIITINKILRIKTKIKFSDEFEIYGNQTKNY